MISTHRTRLKLIAAATLLLCAAAGAFQAATRAVQTRPAPSTALAAMLPQGALLTIESPDFAALLHDWQTSPQSHSWLASANYSVFSNSRLFGRLSDAQDQFFQLAFGHNAPAGASLLTQVAGRQSLFAWYDVGNLEFLYITRMPASQTLQTALMQSRGKFARRQAGGIPFFVRTSKDSPARTVAFAQAGDLLLLATREDLLANALQLIAAGKPGPSVLQEPWYSEASAALPPEPSPPILHMVLNLDRIVPMPYFRSYWVHQNISDYKQYRAAVSDLYRDSAGFRDERAILLESPPDSSIADPDLASLVALAPATGVFRAIAAPAPADAVTALEEKLLGRAQLEKTAEEDAPDPSLDTPASGSASDLETRIDTPVPVSAAFSNQALFQALQAAHLRAILTWSSAQLPSSTQSLWVPIHNAVVLQASTPFDLQTLESALQQSLRGALTAGTLGIEFRRTTQNTSIYTLTGPKPLFLALHDTLALLGDDQALLLDLLTRTDATPPSALPATRIAGFDHTSQRAPFARLTTLVEGTNSAPAATPPADSDHAAPPFFSGTLRSLSDSFAALQSERIVERHASTPGGPILRQTVTYQWQNR